MNQHAPGQDWISIVRKNGMKTYLEWQAKAFGKHVSGTTILTRNNERLIEYIQLYHSPLPVVMEFSRELAKRLEAESRSGFTY